jgi:tetratricopeptide (TPR) repeat protein
MALARRLLGSVFAAVVAGAVFLVHPVQSEAVVWVKCRDDLLSTLFVLIFFLKWLAWREDRVPWKRLSVLGGLYLAACLAKEQAVVLPLMLAAFEYRVFAGSPARRAAPGRVWRVGAVLAALAAVFLAWRHWFIGHSAQTAYLAGSFSATMLTMIRAAARYLGLLVFPYRLLADYSGMDPSGSLADVRVWLSAGVLALVLALVLVSRRRAPVAGAGLLWVAIFLLPMSNVVPMMQYMAERFLYLPMAGFSLTVGAAAGRLRVRHARAAAAAALVLVGLGGLRAAARVPQWRDSLTIFSVTVRDAESTAVRPRRNLLIQLINAGEFARALPLARELWATGERDPAATARDKAERARHLGYVLLRGGQWEEGLRWIRRALDLDPTYFQPCLDFGVVEGLKGRHAEALGWFDRAAQLAPEDPGVHLNRGIALRELGRKEAAEAAFRRSAACGTRDATAYKELAALLWSEGRGGEAAEVGRIAARLFPRDPDFDAAASADKPRAY